MAKMASGAGFGYSTTVGGASISIGWSDNLGASTIELMVVKIRLQQVLIHHLLLL